MKHYGRVTVVALILSILFMDAYLFLAPLRVDALTVTSPTFSFTNSSLNGFGAVLTNPYVVLCKKSNWQIADKVTGIPAAGETWAANAITATQNSESLGWYVALPPLSDEEEWVICLGDSAAPAKTDQVKYWDYSPSTNSVIDDMMPKYKGRILINR